jgi:hypothetical protein
VLSKINCNSIYYNNNYLKNIILSIITENYHLKIEKNFIYNILNNISLHNNFVIDDIILSLKNKEYITNIVNVNYNKYDKYKNFYIKILTGEKLGNNTNKQFINRMKQINMVDNYIVENKNIKDIYDIIKKFIMTHMQFYNSSIYNFYMSHFVQQKITKESFIKNLKYITFINDNQIIYENEIIINEFTVFFESLTEEEIYILNKTISGSTYKLSQKYEINIIRNISNFTIMFHTCFNRMDINYNYFVNEYKDNKKNFTL